MSQTPPYSEDESTLEPHDVADSPAAASSMDAVGVRPAQFPEMDTVGPGGGELPLARFLDVTLSASVELGRALIPIGDVLKLGEGAVLELDREVTEPVDIMVQGIRLARGEVVVVDNCYAVRITEVESGQMGRVSPSGSSRN
ncbi:MAG: flagellar motor switch protein FliN [Planctomycetaceae bacterium]|nr:flagellar motor switch protein FliN [Planctomycetaceae bacterium]